MKLKDILEKSRADAQYTAGLKLAQQHVAALEKVAADPKLAGFKDMALKLVELVKKPFQRAPSAAMEGGLRKDIDAHIQMLRTRFPNSNVPTPEYAKNVNSFYKDQGSTTIKDEIFKHLPGPDGKVVEHLVETRHKEVMTQPEGLDTLKALNEALKVREALSPKDSKLPMKLLVGLSGAFGIGVAMKDIHENAQHTENLQKIMTAPEIPIPLRPRAKEMFQVLKTYAPSIAKDPIFSKDFTKNLIRHDAVDQRVIGDLLSAEKAFHEAKGRRAEFMRAWGGLALQAAGGL